MKALIAALALATLIAAPTFAHPANAAPMSPASSSFGSNGLSFPKIPSGLGVASSGRIIA
jgi:hypothetical protein